MTIACWLSTFQLVHKAADLFRNVLQFYEKQGKSPTIRCANCATAMAHHNRHCSHEDHHVRQARVWILPGKGLMAVFGFCQWCYDVCYPQTGHGYRVARIALECSGQFIFIIRKGKGMQAASEYSAALVRQIEKTYPLSPGVKKAFLAVPRHAFLTPRGDSGREQWLREVYQDTVVVTKLNARGLPLSSSSQPSVMALMLEVLDIQPGMSVLEIGTGTGYNAALLTHLVGDPAKVATIDIDPELTALASPRIEDVVGAGMTIVAGDGRLGVPEHGPYDRMIATASVFAVPPAWIAQLAPGGRLVLDLHGKIGGGLMAITKQADGSATGRFLALKEMISFMALRETIDGDAQTEVFAMPLWEEQTLHAPETVEHACAEHFCFCEQFRGADDGFNLWVQCLFPSLSIKWMRREKRAFALLLESQSQTTLVFEQRGEQMGVAVKGVRPLWDEIVQTYQEWLSLEKPGRTCLTLVMTPEGQEMRIAHEEQSVTLAIRW